MSPIKRIYRRVTTTERLVVPTREVHIRPIPGDTFRVEIFMKDGADETLVYEREHTGSVEVEELDDGKVILTSTPSPNSRQRSKL